MQDRPEGGRGRIQEKCYHLCRFKSNSRFVKIASDILLSTSNENSARSLQHNKNTLVYYFPSKLYVENSGEKVGLRIPVFYLSLLCNY